MWIENNSKTERDPAKRRQTIKGLEHPGAWSIPKVTTGQDKHKPPDRRELVMPRESLQ